MALPNIVNVSQIYGLTVGKLLTASSQDIVTNTVSSSQSFKINTIMCANITALSQSVTVNFYDYSGNTSYSLVYSLLIPANSSIDVLVRPLYLKEGDKIQAFAGGINGVHIVVSYETIQ